MIYVSSIDPIIWYRVSGGVVEMRVAMGEWMVTKWTPEQLEQAAEEGRVKERR